MNLGHTPMLGIAQRAHKRDDIEPEFVLRQRESPLGLRAVWLEKALALSVAAPPDFEDEPDRSSQAYNRAAIIGGRPPSTSPKREGQRQRLKGGLQRHLRGRPP